MRIQPTRNRAARGKQRFLLTLLAGVAASGCATSPKTHSPTLPKFSTLPPGETLSQKQLAAQTSPSQPSNASPPMHSVSYSQGIVLATSQPVFVQDDTPQTSADEAAQTAMTANAQPERGSGSDNLLGSLPDSASAAPQTVEAFVALALSGHPKLRAARQRLAAATHVAPQVSSLPDPTFNTTFWPIQNQALQTAGGRVGQQFGLSQGVPWPEKRRTKASIANREVQMAAAEVEKIRSEVTEAVRLAYYEIWFATRAIAIIDETRGLVDDLTQVAEARYRSGGSQQDVLRAQLEADRLDAETVTLRKQKAQAQADLAALVQQPANLIPEAGDELGLTHVPEQLDALLAMAEQCSPELRTIAWEIQRDRQKEKLACLQKYPDLQFGMNYSIISDNSNVLSPVADGHDNISFTVGTTLPIWRDKIDAGIREAAHRTSSSAQRLEAERDSIQGKLRRLIAQADAFLQQKEIYTERIIPRTEDTLTLAIADYRGERTDFFTLIETYRELLMFETQLARLDANLAGTVAQIQRTVGCP